MLQGNCYGPGKDDTWGGRGEERELERANHLFFSPATVIIIFSLRFANG